MKPTEFRDIDNPMGFNDCSICMADYKPNCKVRKSPACAHFFHDACIMGWIKAKISSDEVLCPLCNAKM
jgi:hypothetical protein